MAVRTLSDISVDGEITMEGLAGYPLTLLLNASAGVNEIASTNRGLNFVVGQNTTTSFKDGSATNMQIHGYTGHISMAPTSTAMVGVGATTPVTKLTVEGPKNVSVLTLLNTTVGSNWAIGDRVGGIDFWSLDGSGGGAGVKGSISYEDATGGTGSSQAMVFRTGGTTSGTNNVERMRLQYNGNVGINTNNPIDKLTVQDGNIRLNTTSSYPAQGLYAYWNNSSPSMGGISWHQNPGFVGSEWTHYKTVSPYTTARIRLQGDTGNNGGMFVNVNNSNVLSVTAAGKVGVMCVPEDPLHVYGTLRVEDTSTSTATYAAISMEGRGMMGSAFTYLRTDYQGNFSVASGLTGSSALRGVSVGQITSYRAGGNTMVLEAGTGGFGATGVVLELLAKNDSSTGQYNEAKIIVPSLGGYPGSTVQRGEIILQTAGNDHIKMTTEAGEFSAITTTEFKQKCLFTNANNMGIGTTQPRSKLDVNGGIKLANDADTATASKAGTLRYRTSGNNSYVDMCMQTGSSTYAWVNIIQNSW